MVYAALIVWLGHTSFSSGYLGSGSFSLGRRPPFLSHIQQSHALPLLLHFLLPMLT